MTFAVKTFYFVASYFNKEDTVIEQTLSLAVDLLVTGDVLTPAAITLSLTLLQFASLVHRTFVA